jgi:hypothetical protein
MNYTTIEFRPSKRDRAIKPMLGALAALATVATLGLLVAGPVALSPGSDATAVARRAAPAPIEVAIVPASIEVVGKRTRVARQDQGGFVPTTFRAR